MAHLKYNKTVERKDNISLLNNPNTLGNSREKIPKLMPQVSAL
jgi:hypothetical protein